MTTTSSSNSVFSFSSLCYVLAVVEQSDSLLTHLQDGTSFHPSLLSLLSLLWPSRVYTLFVHLSVRSVPERDPPWAELREKTGGKILLLYVPAVVNQMGRSCDGSLRWEDPGQLWLMDGRKLRRELATNIKKREKKKKKKCWVRGEGALGNLKPSKK